MADAKSDFSEFTDKKLNALAKIGAGPAVTIYMPIQTPSAKAAAKQENMIRLKNLLRSLDHAAAEYLERHPEVDKATVEGMLASLRESYETGDRFWDPQAAGIALFLAPGLKEGLSLPVEPAEAVHVDDQFHLKPLFAARPVSSPFYLLSGYA